MYLFDKYHDCKQSCYRIRKLSDELCGDHNLSVIIPSGDRIRDLAEIIKYAEQYKANRPYNAACKKAKNPDAYFRKYETQIILYGARRMLEQAGISLKGLDIDKLKMEYQELSAQKNNLTAAYKNCEKEVKSLSRKLEKLNQYLGRAKARKDMREHPIGIIPTTNKPLISVNQDLLQPDLHDCPAF